MSWLAALLHLITLGLWHPVSKPVLLRLPVAIGAPALLATPLIAADAQLSALHLHLVPSAQIQASAAPLSVLTPDALAHHPHLVWLMVLGSKDPSALLSRSPHPNFIWSELKGATVLAEPGPSGALLRHLIALYDLGRPPIQVVESRDLKTFLQGAGIYWQGTPPLSTSLMLQGRAYPLVHLAQDGGPLVSAVLAAPQSLVSHDPALYTAIVRATITYLQRAPAAQNLERTLSLLCPGWAAMTLHHAYVSLRSFGTFAPDPQPSAWLLERTSQAYGLPGGLLAARYRSGPLLRALSTLGP